MSGWVRGLPTRLAPTRTEQIDLSFVTVASVLAIVGFRTTFVGNEELIVGLPAVLAGIAIGFVVAKLRIELLPATAVASFVWVAAGGALAIRSAAALGVLPTPGVVVGLADGLVSGWIRLLTTVPPAGEAGHLLTIPYLVGYLGALTTTVLALRTRGPWCAVGPVAVLLVALLFGTYQPASLLLHGTVLVGVLLAWVAMRHARAAELRVAAGRWRRVTSGAVVIAAVAAAAPFVGPHLPGADVDRRFVLREHVTPPFDPLTEPSPLAGYRRYTGAGNEDAVVLEVEGLAAGVPVRLAVLDDYDGLVWRASGRGDALSGRFVRVGERIPTSRDGTPIRARFTLERPHGVWLPTVGEPTALHLDDRRIQDALRVNVETGTAAVPGGVPASASYDVESVVAPSPDPTELEQLPLDPRYREASDELPTELVELAAQLRGTAEAPYAKLANMAAALRTDGAFSDGGPDAVVATPPGHSLARLAGFLGAPQWVGNGEQYAAALGLLARAEGIPSRVVIGFSAPSHDGPVTITGGDVAAWVEIPLDGVGWVPVSATPPPENVPDPSVRPRQRDLNPDPQPPPPPPPPRHASRAEDLDATDTEHETEEEEEELPEGAGLLLVALAGGGVAALTLSPLLLIPLLKWRRRSRRRRLAAPRARADGGWRELVDRSVDLGLPVPVTATRREVAQLVGADRVGAVATATDQATFGAVEPSDEEIAVLWREIDRALAEVRGRFGRWERLRAAVSLASLRKARR